MRVRPLQTLALGSASALLAALVPAAAATVSTTGAQPSADTATSAAAGDRQRSGGKHPHHGGDDRQAVAKGVGGAVSSVDPYATSIGIEVLRKGGNATDAAVATAAALGVTEPYSAGIGGGGYFVHYDAKTGEVDVVDGRETAPATMPTDAFVDPATGEPYPFSPELVTSGVSVGTPGTLATWDDALDQWGSRSLRQLMRPATKLAYKGFRVDETFQQQTAENAERFAAFTSTSELFLPGGAPPEVGTRFRNPDLARTYRAIAKYGPNAFYRGRLAREIARAAQEPPTTPDTELPVPPGYLTAKDLARYEIVRRDSTRVRYRGLDVHGMPPSSSGGTTVGEALNIMENYRLSRRDKARALHLYFEASAAAFADRNEYVGDPAFVDVPTRRLLSQGFANNRACTIDPEQAAPKPVPAGALFGGPCATVPEEAAADTEGMSTTHLSTVDRWGNAVAYTLTIEQTGGSGIVVPNRGFILNNELTDFNIPYDPTEANRIEPGKRPRSSMSPTIVLHKGDLRLVLGSPGGSTIITTVLQVLLNRIDLDMSLPQALAAPRASQRNTATTTAEQEFLDLYGDELGEYGHAFSTTSEIGAVNAIEVRGPWMLSAAEPERRGGGDAQVVCPRGGKHRWGWCKRP